MSGSTVLMQRAENRRCFICFSLFDAAKPGTEADFAQALKKVCPEIFTRILYPRRG
jgi:hypothetical protein